MQPSQVIRVVPPGDREHGRAAWRAKERIHREEGELAQSRPFFLSQYVDCRDYLVVDPSTDRVHAFAVVRPDGYLSMLGVEREHRRQGLASRLVAAAVADHGRLRCHTSASNRGALAFYEALGFAVQRFVPRYYEDGGDAYALALDAAAATIEEPVLGQTG